MEGLGILHSVVAGIEPINTGDIAAPDTFTIRHLYGQKN
jgi:hypothetical protein